VQFQPLIFGWGVSNVTVTGGGLLYGNGTRWWPCAVDPAVAPCLGTPRPPAFFMPVNGSGLVVHNVTFQDSPMWNLRPAHMDVVHIFNVTILAPSSTAAVPSHNTDGIDPDGCRHVLVEDVDISVGDDVFALKNGVDWWGRTYGRSSYNLTFRRVRAGSGHGISIGSEMSAGIRDVLFEDVYMRGTATGPRIKTQRGRGGYVANVTYRNLVLDGVGESVQVTELYSTSIPPQNASATPFFANITFINVTAINVPSGKTSIGWYAAGLPESHITGVVLQDVDFGAPHKLFANCSFTSGTCANVRPACPPCLTPVAGPGALRVRETRFDSEDRL